VGVVWEPSAEGTIERGTVGQVPWAVPVRDTHWALWNTASSNRETSSRGGMARTTLVRAPCPWASSPPAPGPAGA